MEPTEPDAGVVGIAALAQPLRRDLYALLAERGDWVGRDEAAEALRVPRSVAAFHLDKLAEVGLVEVRFERPAGRGGPGAGRPGKRYRRSGREITVSVPDRHYELAGTLLADAISDATMTGRPAQDALTDVARRTGLDLGRAVRAELVADPPDPGGATITALRRLGYEPHRRGDDIVLVNCPFHRLAQRHRSLVCGMNLDLLAGLTEGIGAGIHLSARLDPAEGLCCVRLASS